MGGRDGGSGEGGSGERGGGERENMHRKVLSHSAREGLEAEEATVSDDQYAAEE